MLNLNKLQWHLKRFIAMAITFFEKMRFYSNGELIIKDVPLLDSKIFDGVEKTTQPGVVKYFILNKETLSLIVKSLKSEKFLPLLKRMGVTKPEISYVTFYQTDPLEDPTQSVYANHWHTDDTLRPNAVKFFQLPAQLDESMGPLEILSRQDTLLNWKKGFIRGHIQPSDKTAPFKFMSSKKGLLANTSKCMHRAGVPEKDKSRLMLMVQINDGAGKCSLEQLYERQFSIEPTLLKNFLSFS